MPLAKEPPANKRQSETGGIVIPNGVDARLGGYFAPLLPVEVWARHAVGTLPPKHELAPVLRWARQLKQGVRELVDGRSENQLEEAGWGVIFSESEDPAIREALSDLLEHRRTQANAIEPLYREFIGDDGLRPGETKEEFLKRHGSGAGSVDPRKVPYYLLLAGDPEKIPFDFQYQLDVRHAVGRIHFDRAEDYLHYARKVVAAESGGSNLQALRRLTLFGPRNPDDWCTFETSRWLVRELGERLSALGRCDWQVETYECERATKERLTSLLGGPATPTILLCACHGLLYSNGDSLQRTRQGALVCQEWAGPLRSQGEVAKDCFLSAEDLIPGGDVESVIAFFFSCFGAATSRWDESDHRPVSQRTPKAPAPFLASLPTRLLSQPAGGALAVIAHVDQAFPHYNGAVQQKTFGDLLSRLMNGGTVGWALEVLNRRYAGLASELHVLREQEELGLGAPVDRKQVFDLWTATNDSRGFVVLGDPAVRPASARVSANE